MSLITKISEITDIYPTSKWDRIDLLQAPLEKVERTKLLRFLGQPLFNQIERDYEDYSTNPDNFLYATVTDESSSVSSDSIARFKLDIIRTCQEIEFYIMLSNNVRILSSSLNRGGGFNNMVADNYETADNNQIEALKKETWRNAMDSVEHLLLLLEEDAETTKVYSELWKKSRYYYQHKDLLFTTAVDMQEYLNIDESRERFIQLIPTVRNCQEIYIGTRIGNKLLRALVELDANSPEYDSLYEVKSLIKQALSQYVDSEISMSPSEAAKVTAKGMETIRQQRNDSHLNGDRLVALAINTILAAPDSYAKYITKGSPLAFEYKQQTGEDYVSPDDRAIIKEAEEQLVPKAYANCQCSKDDKEYDALCDLGGLHLM